MAQERDRNYYGPVVNRCARLRDAAGAGQTVLSHATKQLVADQIPTDIELRDVGLFSLRGLARPERVFEMVDSTAPPGESFNATTHETGHLPRPLSSFVGRGQAVADLEDLLQNSRLVTLTGLGGVGKTRLAIEAASRLEGTASWFVDLEPVSRPERVPETAAGALGIELMADGDVLGAMIQFLGSNPALILEILTMSIPIP